MADRFRDPSPTFDNLLGTRTAPGGSWHFYELGTSSPKATYQDYDLTTPNTNPIVLTASSRFPVPVWLDGEYTVELKAADGSSIINPTDIRPEIAPGLAIPDPLGHENEFLTNDGSVVQWSGPVWMLPDPTGSAGDYPQVNSDGTGYILAALPTPDPVNIDITVTTNRTVLTDEDGTKLQMLDGTASTTTGLGSKQATAAVTYSQPFLTARIPAITPTGGPFAPGNGAGGYLADVTLLSYSATGFTVAFNTNHGEENADGNISAPITFGWSVWGTFSG